MPAISLTQFYGIELDEYACDTATLSLWLAEHGMNVKFHDAFGVQPDTLPLKPSGPYSQQQRLPPGLGHRLPPAPTDRSLRHGQPAVSRQQASGYRPKGRHADSHGGHPMLPRLSIISLHGSGRVRNASRAPRPNMLSLQPTPSARASRWPCHGSPSSTSASRYSLPAHRSGGATTPNTMRL